MRRSPGEGERLPTPVFWPGEFHGQYSPRGHKELDTTERLHFHPQGILLCSRILTKTNCIGFLGVQLLGRVRFFVTPWTAAQQASLSFTVSIISTISTITTTVSHDLAQSHAHRVSDAIQPPHPLSPAPPPAFNLSQHQSLF